MKNSFYRSNTLASDFKVYEDLLNGRNQLISTLQEILPWISNFLSHNNVITVSACIEQLFYNFQKFCDIL